MRIKYFLWHYIVTHFIYFINNKKAVHIIVHMVKKYCKIFITSY